MLGGRDRRCERGAVRTEHEHHDDHEVREQGPRSKEAKERFHETCISVSKSHRFLMKV